MKKIIFISTLVFIFIISTGNANAQNNKGKKNEPTEENTEEAEEESIQTPGEPVTGAEIFIEQENTKKKKAKKSKKKKKAKKAKAKGTKED